MSFILDALKKSETDRQQAGSAEFAAVPASSGNQRVPRWLWILGVLLVINLAVLLGLLFRSEVNPVPATAVKIEKPAPAEADNFAAQVAEAKQNVPARAEPRLPASNTLPAPSTTSAPSVVVASEPMNTVLLPTIHEVRADGRVTLPELHVDIHVYSEVPEDRFVFINMNKHTEGSRLAEGPLVEEITTDGVVLNQNGTLFLVPRD
ncbi:MAG: general secretion pathway protein GspB [Gammaproteobacteria bacterium]|jgi:general secretion pathway protein B|nr:general secretion pathway protein GspB [Gammaproteobacteria bacterium]